ncbi:MAG: MBL fold metallo-hydrolase [Dehalococcoidia bacterium]|nr:MBL fold metallo-hydrolase [Dehalococcoidia bacterium]MDZ4246494.1 MBL fold metallo-hydrolase [Dehalococcoidia bacterium]
MIIKNLTVGPFGSNCYIVGSEKTKEGIIIDPGEEADTILAEVKKAGLKIVLIVATHGHLDHMMALEKVKDALKCDYAIHEGDAAGMGHEPPAILSMFGLPRFNPPPPDRALKDGDTIEFGDESLKVVHTPGHSRGGICLVGDGVVFSGDTLFNFGIGRTDLPGGNYEELMGSIKEKLMVLPDKTEVWPGHGPGSTIGEERRHNPFLGGAGPRWF